DELLEQASQITDDPPGRELDMLLTAGERISMALLAIAISTHGYEARSFTGSQAGVITTSSHGKARIIDGPPRRRRRRGAASRRLRDLHRRGRRLHRRPADRPQRQAPRHHHLRGDARGRRLRRPGAEGPGRGVTHTPRET